MFSLCIFYRDIGKIKLSEENHPKNSCYILMAGEMFYQYLEDLHFEDVGHPGQEVRRQVGQQRHTLQELHLKGGGGYQLSVLSID